MPPPYNINETSPSPSSLISSFPADEQSNRAVIEDWLSFISDPATGQIRASVLPPAGSAEVPSGSKMIFVQTSAPSGWTKDTTHNNKALRVVNGTAGSGGSVSFTSAFTSQTPAGTISQITPAGTLNAVTDTGTVGATAISAAQMPAHQHSVTSTGGTDAQGTHTHSIIGSTTDGGGNTARGGGVNNITLDNAATAAGNHAHNVTVSGTTSVAGSGATHTHSLTMNAHTHTFTGSPTTPTFTGTAIDLAVAYVDVIICTRN